MAISEPGARRRVNLPAAAGALLGLGCLVAAADVLVGLLPRVLASPTAPWIFGRAAGLAAYLMMVALVLLGLALSHPATRRLRWPPPPVRVGLHVALAVFTLAFVLIHVVALVLDPWAHVGVAGALLPMASSYRPVGVTLGVLAMWAAALTALTAVLAGRALGRSWWFIHRVAIVVLLLAWTHGLLAGSDARSLRSVYLWTGLAVTAAALARYLGSPTTETSRSRVRRGRP